jgi:DMSO/TMAO reductase YedYZ molybdopterin-dependent catalytic subunit
VFSLRHRRRTQRLTGRLVDPFEHVLSRSLSSHQRYTRADISPYHRVNGYPPPDPVYRRLAERGFTEYRLEVSGLVDRPLSLSLEELRDLGTADQITKHNCIQGWTNIAEWGGVPLEALLDRCQPRPQARYLVFYAYDDKTITENEGRFGHFYGTLPLQLARRPQTILALDMNGKPLPIEHGAPVRLRVETQLGFKMVKWIRAIELVEDYTRIGMGQGGWREDQQYYANAAGI